MSALRLDLTLPLSALVDVSLTARDIVRCSTTEALNYYFLTKNFEGEPDTALVDLISTSGEFDTFEKYQGGGFRLYQADILTFAGVVNRVTIMLSGLITIEAKSLYDSIAELPTKSEIPNLSVYANAPLNIGRVNAKASLLTLQANFAISTSENIARYGYQRSIIFPLASSGHVATSMRIGGGIEFVPWLLEALVVTFLLSPAIDANSVTVAVKSQDTINTAVPFLNSINIST